MKKKEATRNFNFSDAELIAKGREKVAFIRRDALKFATYGIIEDAIDGLEHQLDAFAANITDIEAVGDQTGITALKNTKAEELRVAIRNIMTRVELQYGIASAQYRKFGTEMLSKQTDAELQMTAKRVARVASLLSNELLEKGVTPAMLAQLTTVITEMENLMIDMQIKIGERDFLQEDRVEMANAIYEKLITYLTTGQNIWSTTNVARYNDYILYNSSTGEVLPTEDAASQ